MPAARAASESFSISPGIMASLDAAPIRSIAAKGLKLCREPLYSQRKRKIVLPNSRPAFLITAAMAAFVSNNVR
jgi:hypothetical protein